MRTPAAAWGELLYRLHFPLQREGVDGEPDDVPPGAVDESGPAAAPAVHQAAVDKDVKHDVLNHSPISRERKERGILILLPVVIDDVDLRRRDTWAVRGHVTEMDV